MERLRLLPFAMLLPLGCVGCLQLEQEVILAADGSGKLTFGMTMREATVAEVRQASAAAQLGAAVDPTAVFDRQKTERDLREAGFELDSYKAEQKANKRTVALAASFADFATLQRCPLNGTRAEWVLKKGPKPGTAKLTLYPQGRTAWLEARKKAAELQVQAAAGTIDPMVAGFFRKRQQQLAGLDLKFRVQLPGDVLLWTKTWKKTGNREVTAHVRAADIRTPEDLVRRLAPRFEVVFDSRGLQLPLQ
ncbi:MAG: hypothetical protein NXI31_04775 [bacterium]|nr:hypothetical protein [bacterium]